MDEMKIGQSASMISDDWKQGLQPSTVKDNHQLELFDNSVTIGDSDYYIDSLTMNSPDQGLSIDFGNLSTISLGDLQPSWSHSSIEDLIYNPQPGASITGNLNVTDGHININGVSLADRLAQIEERLGVLVPNPKLEQDYEKLKKLGERYRRLEKKLLEQNKTWDILKRDDDNV